MTPHHFTSRRLYRYVFLSALITTSFFRANAEPPINNPISEYYHGPFGYPAWTDAIRWDKVVDMGTYRNGTNDFEKFENARDELAKRGGGVLYYPSGEYDFSDMPADGPQGRGLMLKSGVVIRGETPSGDRDARNGSLQLATTFIFPTKNKAGGIVPRDWNVIGMIPSDGESLRDINNIGVVWIRIRGGCIYWGPDIVWGTTWETAGSWKSEKVKSSWKNRIPDGTHPIDPFAGGTKKHSGEGNGRIVFGCSIEDAVILNDCIDEGFGSEGFAPFKFGPRIGAYGSRVFIANNTLPKSNRNFIYPQKTSSGSVNDILFDYGKVCGIDVNKELLGWVRNDILTKEVGGYFAEGVVVIDNFVFNHGHKGFTIGGKWAVIRNNRNERLYLQENDTVYNLNRNWVLTLDGYKESKAGGSGSSSDNLSRAFDLAGKALWIDSNTFNNTGSNPGNDGEGILCQRHGGTDLFSWAITNNVHEKGNGNTGYIGGYDVHHYGSLIAWNKLPGWVGNAKAGNLIDAAFVGNDADDGISTTDSQALTECPTHPPAAPAGVNVLPQNDHIEITWTDASDDEIGFRIDRKTGSGTWTTIAFRPRKATGTIHNRQAWYDFMAPGNKQLFYRVVAIDCDNSTVGASTGVGPVTLTTRVHTVRDRSYRIRGLEPVIRTNGNMLSIEHINGKHIRLKLYNLNGTLCLNRTYEVHSNRLTISLQTLQQKLGSGCFIVSIAESGQYFKEETGGMSGLIHFIRNH